MFTFCLLLSWNKLHTLEIERNCLLSSVLQRLEWWLIKSKQWLGSVSPIDQALLQLLPCLSFPLFSFVTSSVTFLLDVAAVKRQGEHIIDRRMEVITSSCPGEGFNPPENQGRSRHRNWLNYWLSLIGSLYGLWWKQNVTLKARLPLLSALCVSPINLYVPPSPLPFYVQLKPLFKWAGVVRLKVPTCETALRWLCHCFPRGS